MQGNAWKNLVYLNKAIKKKVRADDHAYAEEIIPNEQCGQ